MKKNKFFILCIIAIALCASPLTVMASPLSPSPAFGTSFDSSFIYDHAGWTPFNGVWKIENGKYASVGTPRQMSRIRHNGLYKDMIYQATMIRQGCLLCANGLVIHASGDDTEGHWTTGYYFQYANNGQVIVFKAMNGIPSVLMRWTYFSAVKRGALNKLMVIAAGTTYRFYINNVMVWSGFDTSIPTNGQVGVGFYTAGNGPGDKFSVDWARLTFSDDRTSDRHTMNVVKPGAPTSWENINMAPAP